MFQELIYMYGLFQLLRLTGQNNLRLAKERRTRRKSKHVKKAVAFVGALLATRPRRTIWARPQSHHWWDTVVLETFTDDQWLAHFRMRRDTFDILCGKLRPLLDKEETQLRRPIQLQKRVAVAIWYLATSADFRTLSELFGIGKATVHFCVWEVCLAIRTLQRHFISLPKGEKLQNIVDGFEKRWGFPQCCGSLDGSHIPVTPPSNNAKDYFNRKGSFSIILQAVVDHLSRFTNINVGWPGSVHDTRVLRNSTLFELVESGNLFPPNTREVEGTQVPLMLVGDPAYPLLPWLMKGRPDTGHLSREEKHFNYRLSRARITVECAFGRLKGRWRCLLKKMEVDISKAPTIVVSCCVLRNLCELQGDDFFDAWLQNTEEPAEVNTPDIPIAEREQPLVVRRALAQYFSGQDV